MARVDPELSHKIKVLSLYASVAVVFNHAYNLDAFHVDPGVAMTGTYFTENFVRYGLSRITTPFFFVVAAWTFFLGVRSALDGYRDKLRKRAGSLVVPYLIWSAWSALLIGALQVVPQLGGMSQRQTLLSAGPAVWVDTLLVNPVAYQLWFVRDLVLLMLLSPLVYLLISKWWLASMWLAACCVAWYVWPDVHETRAVLFFSLGAWIAVSGATLATPAGWQVAAAWIGWITLITVNTLHILQYGAIHPWVCNTAILMGLIALWTGYDRVKGAFQHRVFAFLGAYTFFIYVAHEPLVTLARKAVTMVIGRSPAMVLPIWIITSVSVIAALVLIAWLLQRFAPVVFGIQTGGRGLPRRCSSMPVSRAAPVAAVAESPATNRWSGHDPLPAHDNRHRARA